MNAEFYDLRVVYRKRGLIKYISHLDMNRLMQRAFSRAKLPVWYTQGFNPHLYLTFALPLSLGFESDYEVMDLRLVEELPEEEVVRRLNGQMPQGVTVVSAAPPVRDVHDIAWCVWRAGLETERPEAALHELEALLAGPIPVEKKTKRGVKEVDIRPLVEVSEMSAGKGLLELRMRCAAGSETNVNPTLLLGALCARTGDDARDVRILRETVLCQDGTVFA